MLVIRLSRTGRKKRPHYRMVVAEKSAPIKGRHIEVLGHYDPRTKDLVIDADAAKARLAAGAQPSETAAALLEREGILKRDKITDKNRRPTRTKKNPAEEAAPAAAAEGEDAGEEAATEEAPADTTPEETPAEEASAPDDAPNQPDTTEEADTDREEAPAEKPAEESGDAEESAEESSEESDKDKESA